MTATDAAIRPMSPEELRTAMYCTNRAGRSCQATARVWVAGQPYCKACGGRASKMIAAILEWREPPDPCGTLVHAMANIPCEERARLQRAVRMAVQVRCDTKPKDRGQARIAERHAVTALDEHVALHHCVRSRNQKE
jgi:hypothetical protein